jgi:hypothetical protein
MTIEKTNYHGWANSYRISNGEVEAIVTGDVGPRIIRFGFTGGQNFFREFEDQLGRAGEPEWQPRGGHRLWMAPEDPVLSYPADNFPVDIALSNDGLTATAPVEPLTGLEKQIAVRMEATGTNVEVVHRIRNAGSAPCRVAPWALSMMARGGYGIHGFPPRGTHPEMLAPTNPLVMWAFTDLSDPRWTFTSRYMVLRQDPAAPAAQKLGTYNARTWGAYLLNGELFLKRYDAVDGPSAYPDFGCSYETFTNADILELETLGPLATLQPGESLTHTERWSAFRGVRIERWTDEEIDRVLGPLAGA